MTRNRPAGVLSVLTLAALLALISAGCGASATSTTGAGGSSGASASAAAQGKAVKFAECIRGHGVPHFPDPDAKGEFVFGIDVSPTTWDRAVVACKALEPPGAVSGERSPTQQSAALRFAGCMREDGVKDFPDPANGDPLVDTTKIPSSNRPGGMTILNAAMKRCGAALGLAAGGGDG